MTALGNTVILNQRTFEAHVAWRATNHTQRAGFLAKVGRVVKDRTHQETGSQIKLYKKQMDENFPECSPPLSNYKVYNQI